MQGDMLTSFPSVVSESSTIFSVLSKNFLIDEALIDTFDGVSVPEVPTESS